jgi:hypothetical protein
VLRVFDFGEVPDEIHVVTTRHDAQPLEDVFFWFAKHSAFHPSVPLPRLLIVHVAPVARCDELLDQLDRYDEGDKAGR